MALSPIRQWLAMGTLTIVAAAVILVSAEPFAESMIESGRLLGFGQVLADPVAHAVRERSARRPHGGSRRAAEPRPDRAREDVV